MSSKTNNLESTTHNPSNPLEEATQENECIEWNIEEDFPQEYEPTFNDKLGRMLKRKIKAQLKDVLFSGIPHCYLEEYAFHHGHPGYGIKWFHENEFRKVIKRCERKHIYINGIEAISENGQQFCMIEYCYKWLNIFPRVKPKNRDCGGLQIEQCQERRYQPAIYDTLKTIDYEINWFRFAFEEFVEEAMNRNIKIERYSATCSF